MSNIQIFLLAIIQGVTEFLPISSSAHLNLLSLLTEFVTQPQIINVAVHFGSMFAVVIYFRSEVLSCFKGVRDIIYAKRNEHTVYATNILIASPPIFIVGAFFVIFDIVDMFRTIAIIAIVNVIFAFLLWHASRRTLTKNRVRKYDAFLIGMAQILAIIPGVSRSGITMTMACYQGIGRLQAARFSMMLSLPVILGATLAELIKWDTLSVGSDVNFFHIGLAIFLSFVAAYISIVFMLRILEKIGFFPFVLYRIFLSLVLGIFILWT